jgi:hypothetical protein
MWCPDGAETTAKLFVDFSPEVVFYDFDGPRIFSVRDQDGLLFLAYQCDESSSIRRFLVVPLNAALEHGIRTGTLPVRDAITQPHLFVADIDNRNTPVSLWKTSLDKVPEDVLPRAGTMLLPELQPFFTIRFVGKQIGKGTTIASVIRSSMDRAEKCLKTLIHVVIDRTAPNSRPLGPIRRLYDLPTTSFAFNSFEVAFGSPTTDAQQCFKGIGESPQQAVAGIFMEVSRYLSMGLEWLASDPNTAESLNGSEAERRAILQALLHVVPTSHGSIETIELGGKLLRELIVRNPKACKLNRAMRPSLRRITESVSKHEDRIVTLSGRVREADVDTQTFELRNVDAHEEDTRLAYQDDLQDDVLDALGAEYKVKVVARRTPRKPGFEAIAIEKAIDSEDVSTDATKQS